MYAVLGATGHTGKIVADRLLTRGENVRVIGRSAERLKPLTSRGAEPFVSEFTDSSSLTRAFAGAKGAYVLIPQAINVGDVRAYQGAVTDALARALEDARVEYAVAVSSIGADKPDKTGPVVGLRQLEQRLNAIPGLNVLYLRAGYFMENTLPQAQLISTMGMMAGPLRAGLKIPMIATRDIGEAAADELLRMNFTGSSTRELLGPRDVTMTEVAEVLGMLLDKPELKYVQAPDEQIRVALLQIGMSGSAAGLLLEMTAAMNSGYMRALEPRSESNTTPTSYETFAREVFVPFYKGTLRAA